MKSNITYPRKTSNTARFLARFLLGERLRHRQADNVVGSYRLAGYVGYLTKKHGWNFDRHDIKDDSLDPIGRSSDYTEYWLPIELINWAGIEGQDYARKVLSWEAERIAERVETTTPSKAASEPSEDDNSETKPITGGDT